MTMKPADDRDSLVNLADITEIELLILRRMKGVTMGEHRKSIGDNDIRRMVERVRSGQAAEVAS